MKTMNDYTCHCTEEQTRRAYKLGAPIRKITNIFNVDNGEQFYRDNLLYVCMGDFCCVIPTTQQMIGWLREKGFWIYVKRYWQYNTFYACIEKQGLVRIECTDDFEKPEQAERAAIDAALDYLEKGGKL